jgi:hypothetical protein
MDLQDYTSKLYDAEQRVDVNQFQSNGVELWPLYRYQTISMFKSSKAYYSKREKNIIKNTPIKNFLRFVYCKIILYKKVTKYINNTLKAEPTDIFLYSKNSTHSDQIDGGWYDKFVDPFFELLNSNYKIRKIELVFSKDLPKDRRVVDTTFINIKDFENYYLHSNKYNKLLDLSKNTRKLSKLTSIDFVDRTVNYAFYEIFKYKEIFSLILKRIKPKFIFLKCYYEYDSFGLVLAAKELGIKTIDIQHGKQGIYHPMYTHFSKIPKNGYKLLPDYFWNWGDESMINIEKWQNNKTAHQAMVGGNLWLAKWKFSDFYKCKSNEENNFIDSLKKSERVILYSTQPITTEGILPTHIVQTIQQSPSNWTWLIRIHPFQKLTEGEILKVIGNCKARIEIKYSTELPLYLLLKNVTHHIALWSSTCFEANEFNIPTIISHTFGGKLYDEFFKSNVFFYSINPDEIIELIQSGKKNEKCNYIETSEEIAKDALQKIGLKISKFYA